MTDVEHVIRLDVAPDFVSALSKLKKPITGIEELVWNALDADATRVDVILKRNVMDGLELIRVVDNGHGMSPEEKERSFGMLGGSHKRVRNRSPGGRILHGREGKGRFRAFGLGTRVEWSSKYALNGKLLEWSLSGAATNLCAFSFSDSAPAKGSSGTAVTITNVDASLGALTSQQARLDLLTRFALYLRAYPQAVVVYDGAKLDVSKVQERVKSYDITAIGEAGGKRIAGKLTIIEWTPEMERKLYLCTVDGLTRAETTTDIKAKDFNFTAYLESRVFDDMDSSVADVAEMNPVVARLVDAARARLRDHFIERKRARLEEVIAAWKAEGVYPYPEAPQSPVAKAEREVFEICAISVHQRLPGFALGEVENRRLTLRLLKQAVETSPSSLQTILREVLDLPKYVQDDMAELLQRSKLESIIKATKIVTDRLTFIGALEQLLFDKKYKNRLLERSQLHRILIDELWVFGEQYVLGLDDQSLKALLESHLKVLERNTLAKVVRSVGREESIPDVMLWRRYADRSVGRYEHLVIELKRPNKKLGQEELSQIERYALTVAGDERFDKGTTKWIFVLVGDDLNKFAEEKCTQDNRPFGLIVQKPHVEVWVRKWATILQECKWRHEFYRDKLDLEVQTSDASAYLQKKHAQYVPKGVEQSDAKPLRSKSLRAGSKKSNAKH